MLCLSFVFEIGKKKTCKKLKARERKQFIKDISLL